MKSSDFQDTIRYRLEELKKDTMDSGTENEIMAAHREYTALVEYANWIVQLGGNHG